MSNFEQLRFSDSKYSTIDESALETVISEDVYFDGKMTLTDPILIKGRVEGDINSGSNVFVSKGAQVRANIDAPIISVQGEVAGKIHASKRLELLRTGTLNGEIHAPDLVIQSGSVFNGSCIMSGSSAKTSTKKEVKEIAHN